MKRTDLRAFALLVLTLFAPLTRAIADEMSVPLYFFSEDTENSNSQFPEVDKPIPNSFRLLGRGIQTKDGQQSIALSCYNDDCSQVRFIYFSNQNPKWIGSSFAFQIGDPKLASMLVEQYLLRRTAQRDLILDSKAGKVIGPGVVYVATPIAAAVANAVATTTVAAVGIFMAPAAAFLIFDFLTVGGKTNFVSNEALGTFTVTRGEQGWTWAENAERVKAKKFQSFLSTIEACKDWGNCPSQPSNKYYRRENRLYKYLKTHPSSNPEIDQDHSAYYH